MAAISLLNLKKGISARIFFLFLFLPHHQKMMEIRSNSRPLSDCLNPIRFIYGNNVTSSPSHFVGFWNVALKHQVNVRPIMKSIVVYRTFHHAIVY